MKKILLTAVAFLGLATACVSNKDFDEYTLATQNTINALNSKNGSQDALILELQDNLAATTAALKADIEANAGNITANAERLIDEVESITIALDALVEADANIEAQLNIIRGAIDKLIINFEAEVVALQEDLAEGLNTLEYDISIVIEDLKAELIAADELLLSVANAYADANDATFNPSGLQNQIDAVVSDLDAVEDNYVTQETLINSINNAIEALPQDIYIADVQNYNGNVNLILSNGEVISLAVATAWEHNQLIDLINDLQGDVSELQSQVTGLLTDLGLAQAAIDNLIAQGNIDADTIATLQEELAAAQSSIDTLIAEGAATAADLDVAQQSIKDLWFRIGELQEDIELLELELNWEFTLTASGTIDVSITGVNKEGLTFGVQYYDGGGAGTYYNLTAGSTLPIPVGAPGGTIQLFIRTWPAAGIAPTLDNPRGVAASDEYLILAVGVTSQHSEAKVYTF